MKKTLLTLNPKIGIVMVETGESFREVMAKKKQDYINSMKPKMSMKRRLGIMALSECSFGFFFLWFNFFHLFHIKNDTQFNPLVIFLTVFIPIIGMAISYLSMYEAAFKKGEMWQ